MNTPIIVTTCDKYDWLLAGFAERFNTFWSPCQPVTVLCYRPIPDLPLNFVQMPVSAENQAYTAMLREWLAKNPDATRVILMLEDYWLKSPVNVAGIEYMGVMMDRDEWLAKFHLDDAVQRQECTDKAFPLVELAQNAIYRASLQAAIWRTDYLAKLCEDDRNPWEFEIKGRKETINDSKRIMGSRRPPMVYDNVMLKGNYVGP